jgi:hypothetical protein
MAKKPKTNVQFVKNFMDSANPFNQAFVINGVAEQAKEVLVQFPTEEDAIQYDKDKRPFMSMAMWRETALEFANHHKEFTGADIVAEAEKERQKRAEKES